MKRLLPLLLLAASSAALAESGAYRVEIIVFRNLSATGEIAREPELRGFSQFPDLQNEGPPQAPAAEPAEVQAGDLPAQPVEIMQDNLPDDLRVLADRSTTMDGVWRRLRSSQTYRPLLYTSWEQNRVDYYPPMRIHDEQVIDTRLRPPTHIVTADLTAADPLAAYRSVFYQLDGSLQLKRSRFLHLFLDLEFRDQDHPAATGAATPEPADMQPPGGGIAAGYGIYSLTQNRQINTGEMQYFDTPFYGALVYVTAVP